MKYQSCLLFAASMFAVSAHADIVKCSDAQGNITYSNVKANCPSGKKLDIPNTYPKAQQYIPKTESIYASPQQAGQQFQQPMNGIPFILPKPAGGVSAPMSLPPLPAGFQPQAASPQTAPMEQPKQPSTAQTLTIPEGQGGVFLKPPTETPGK